MSRKKMTVAVNNDEMDDSSHTGEKVGLLVFQGQTDQPAVVNGWLEQRVTYGWWTGLFGDSCSKVCGEGEKTREVKCTSSVGGGGQASLAIRAPRSVARERRS